MRRLIGCLAAALLVFGAEAQAAVVQVGSAAALAATDFFDWGQVRVGFAVPQPSPQNVTSNLGATGSINDGGVFTGLIQSTDWFGDFLPGENVLFTGDPNNPFAAASSFTMNFDTAVSGLGLQLSSNFFGAFTASLEVFDNAVSLGVFNVAGVMSGSADGSAPFLGARSDSTNITRGVFTLTSNTGAGLGANRLLTTNLVRSAPEPASLALLGLGIAALGARRRRR